MKDYVKYCYLSFVFISLIFFGSFSVGPLTLRNYATLLFLIVSLHMSRDKIIFDHVVKGFIAYLTVLILCNIINGCLFSTIFFRMSIAFLLPSLLIILFLPYYISTKKDFEFVILFLIVIYVLNLLVTYGQFLGIPICWEIINFIGFESWDESEEELLGGFFPGLLGKIVTNGYFLASFLPIATIGFFHKNIFLRIGSLSILMFAGLVMYVVQQRMAFLSLILYVIFLLFVKKDKSLIWGVVLFLGLTIFKGNVLNGIEMGRLSADEDNSSRIRLFNQFWTFANTFDVIFGHYINYLKIGGIQHNCFTAVITLGGIPTFISFVILYYHMLKKNILIIVREVLNNYVLCVLSVSCIIYAIYGLTHSSGLHNEGLYFWICYALILSFKRINKTN